jgi:hypothetical protein
MKTHFEITGYLLMLLSLAHLIFPKYFKWKEDLKSLSLINRQMMIVHTFFIALTVFLMGLLFVTSSSDLLTTNLGRTICLGLGIFWGCRLGIQFFGYSSQLWKGKPFETSVHILFSAFWIYITTICWIVALQKF